MSVKAATEEELAEFPFEQKTVKIGKASFTFRELSVQENDDCADGARGEDKQINFRTMMRLMILASAVEPPLTAKALGKLPQRVYARIYETVNTLNDPDTLPDDDEGNA